MRHVLPLLALAAAVAVPAAAEVTRTHRLELAADAAAGFTVQNLSGQMTVRPGTGSRVVVKATVHGEDAALADSVRLVQDTGEDGRPRLLVRYPVDRHTSYRAPGRHAEEESTWSWLASMFGADGASFKYDGHRVQVGSRGVLLWADVEVELPAQSAGVFKNHAGPITSSGTRGKLRFDSGRGDITLDDVSGEVTADTGSGNVKARRVGGTFKCDTGSGDCRVEGFQGRLVDCDTGSGNVKVDASGVEEVRADTGSGDVSLSLSGPALRRVVADTGSGDVTVRMDKDASFQVSADLGSGDIVNRYADAQAVMRDREVRGYRRGDGRAVIKVDTGSGDLVLEPR